MQDRASHVADSCGSPVEDANFSLANILSKVGLFTAIFLASTAT